MIFDTDGRMLRVTGILERDDISDVFRCRSMAGMQVKKEDKPEKSGAQEEEYLVWIIHDRTLVKYILSERDRIPWIRCFPHRKGVGFVINEREERLFMHMWNPREHNWTEGLDMCRNIVALCMTSNLPQPVLYLLLRNRKVNIAADGSLYFRFDISLKDFDSNVKEKECVEECLKLIFLILEQETGRKRERRQYLLLKKKFENNRYGTFLEVFTDLKKRKRKKKGRTVSDQTKKRLFYGLTVTGVVLLTFTAVLLISQIVLGEIPVLRVFDNGLEQIGPERLIQDEEKHEQSNGAVSEEDNIEDRQGETVLSDTEKQE